MNRAIEEAIKRTPRRNNGYEYSKIEKLIINAKCTKDSENEIKRKIIETLLIREQNGISKNEKENGEIIRISRTA